MHLDFCLQAVRSFQVAVHMCPAELPLWTEDLAWALKLQKQRREMEEMVRQQQDSMQQLLEVPELVPDYDFEGDEVVAACAAIAERQKRYDSLQKAAVIVGASGTVETQEDSADMPLPSQAQFVKARGLWHNCLSAPVPFLVLHGITIIFFWSFVVVRCFQCYFGEKKKTFISSFVILLFSVWLGWL